MPDHKIGCVIIHLILYSAGGQKNHNKTKKHHKMLSFYAPSVALFAGSRLPAGSELQLQLA